MSDSVLSQVALSCEAVCSRTREVQAFVLKVQSLTVPVPEPSSAVHVAQVAQAAHLARVLRELHTPQSVALLVHPDTPALASGLLCADDALPGALVVEHAWLDDAGLVQALLRSPTERAVVLRMPPAAALPVSLAQRFARRLLAPELRHTVAWMAQATASRSAAQRAGDVASGEGAVSGSGFGVAVAAPVSPVVRSLSGCWVEGIASARLAAWCLDEAGAAGVRGWPVDEALTLGPHDHAGSALPVDLRIVRALLGDIDADAALETLHERLCSDPLLAWRFLRFVNSAGLGFRSEIETVRHGLMMVGSQNLREWLRELRPRASDAADLRPLRAASVMCARLTALLVDAGNQVQLTEELSLCGLFAELEALAGEPMADLIAPLPLPARVRDAVLHQRGPYGTYLSVARALLGRTPSVAAVCRMHEFPLEEANRALLRVMAATPAVVRQPW